MVNKISKIAEIEEQIKKSGNLPVHVAIIMDGNGRWAKQKGLPRIAGHKKGVEVVRTTVNACISLGIKYLTLYTFSTENWKRPKSEVSTLMHLLVRSLRKEIKDLQKNNIRLVSCGDINSLPEEVQKELHDAEKKTANNTALVLNLALSYSGRWDILNAVKKIAEKVKKEQLKPSEITEEVFSNNLSTAGIPDVDLLIRTSGELRISNFLLWQIAYSEIAILDIFWPDFSKEHFYNTIRCYQLRERRFGMVSEQIENRKKG